MTGASDAAYSKERGRKGQARNYTMVRQAGTPHKATTALQ